MTPFPIESLAGDHRTLGLVLAVALGAAFGFVLERAGLGRVQKLVGQFHGDDMTVLRVLFTAIATAMAGAVLLSSLGLLDLPLVQLRYPTYLWPMIVGGLVLGAGFATSGYCPGTCVVAAASGKLDGLATLGGVALGGVVYAELEAAMGAFPRSGALGPETLSHLLRIPAPAVVVGVVALALGAFAGAARVERHLRGRDARAVRGPQARAPAPDAPVDAAVSP